jgi:acetyl esterase/lipase
MKTGRVLAGLAAALFVAAPVRADPPPVEAFGALPKAEIARLSPDGKRLAVIKPVDGREKVAVYDLTRANAAPYVVGMDGGLAGDTYWKGNDHLVCIFRANLTRKWGKNVSAWSRALSVNPVTQTAVLLLYNVPLFKANRNAANIADMVADDPGHIYMTALNRWDGQVTEDLYRVDLATGLAEMAAHGSPDTVEFLTDGYGHMLGHIDQDSSLVDHVFLGKREAYKYPVRGASEFQIEGMTAGQNPQFAVGKPTPYGTTGLYTWKPSGEVGAALFENPIYDKVGTIRDERSGLVIGVAYIDDMVRAKYFDPALQRVQDSLEKAFPGQSVEILSRDDAGSSYVVLTDGPRNPPVLSLYTTANRQVNIVEEAYPSLKPPDLGEVRPYPYKSRDGLDIHAYLTLPPGKDPHNLPTVIFPHGGPETRDSMNFDWWAQFMASRGYAVLQPNYRGSSGYGWNFVKGGDGEWAGKAQYDVQDGVQKLIADGIADPRRICIVGASWGGYMALAGATFSPDLYQCAVSYAGPSDLKHGIYEGTTFESEVVSVWKRRFGADENSHKLDEQSPADFAERVKIPILLIHSDKDTTVNIDQSEIEERALKRAGKDVEFVKLEGDDHYLEFADTRIKLLKEIERFLAAHIGDKAMAEKQAN